MVTGLVLTGHSYNQLQTGYNWLFRCTILNNNLIYKVSVIVRMKLSLTPLPGVPTASGCLHNLIQEGNKSSEVVCWWNVALHGFGPRVGWLVTQPVHVGWVDEDPRWHGGLTIGGWRSGELGWCGDLALGGWRYGKLRWRGDLALGGCWYGELSGSLWAGQSAVAWLQLRNSCGVVVVCGAGSDMARTAVAEQFAFVPNMGCLSAGVGGHSEELTHLVRSPLTIPYATPQPPTPTYINKNAKKEPTSLVGGERLGHSCRQWTWVWSSTGLDESNDGGGCGKMMVDAAVLTSHMSQL